MADPNSQLTDTELKVRESGLDRPGEVPKGPLPPGGGQWPVPHHQEFVGLVNQVARAYRWTFDEALRDSRPNAIAMRNDVVLMEALRERQMMTAQLGWHLIPRDETDQQQVDAAAKLTRVIQRTPDFQKFLMLLLEAVWYGRFGLELKYEWDQYDPTLLVVNGFRPINGDSLVPRWSGDWGVLVSGVFEGDKQSTDRGYAHFFTDAEKEVTLIHTHEPEAADYTQPELAGGVHGVGLRGRVYWYWWLKQQFLAMLADYIERFSWGIWVAYYDQNNPQGKEDTADAIAGYRQNRALLFPRSEQGQTPYGLEIKDPPTSAPGLIHGIIEYLDAAMRRLFLGLAMADGMEVGVGGDGADLITSRVSRTVKYDANALAETLTRYWIPVLARWNCPGIPPPYFKFQVDRPQAEKLIGYAERLVQLGAEVDLAQLMEAAGLTIPAPGATTVGKVQPLQPTAVVQQPQGVPVASDQPQTVPATVTTNNVG